MKKIYLSTILLFLFIISCNLKPNTKEDNEIFTSIEPIEWSPDYVFNATNSPSSIQIWNSKTNRLVKDISLKKEGRALTIIDMDILEKSIWLIGYGKSYNLIRIDLETGIFEFKEFSYEGQKSEPYDLKAVNKEIDGVGTVWVKSHGNPDNGTLFISYNSDGTKRNSFCIECSITGGEMEILYKNDCFYTIGSVTENRVITNDDEQSCFELIDLTNKTVTQIKNKLFFGDNFINRIYGDIQLKDFRTQIKSFENYYLCVNVVNSYVPGFERDIADRFYYKIKSIEPFEVEYLDIYIPDTRAISFYEDENNYFIFTNPFSREEDIDGLDVSIFNKKTKKREKSFSIENTNQLFVQKKDDIVWISMNSCRYIGNNKISKNVVPKICKYDYTKDKFYIYAENGEEQE